MAVNINLNRYRLITLLYVIFVCLSVLNIPSSLLDSYFYSIMTLEYEIKSTEDQVGFANRVIQDKQVQLNASDSARVFLGMQNRIHSSYEKMKQFDLGLQKYLDGLNTDTKAQFNNRKYTEAYFLKDSALNNVKKDLVSLVTFLKSQPYQVDQAIEALVPMRETILSQSGALKEWDTYLFLHKPTAISYFHIKRIQLILIQNENIYQNAALKTIGYQPSYYSEKEKEAILFQPNTNTTKNIEQQLLQDTFPKTPAPKPQPPAAPATPKYPVQADSTNDMASNTDNFDEFIQRIITSLHSETFYVGIQNEVLREFNYLMGVDFDFEITPNADVRNIKNSYFIKFPKTGLYTLRFSDRRKFKKKVSFEKKVQVQLIPPPQVKLSGDGSNSFKEFASVKDLFSANRLVTYLQIYDIPTYASGRINSYYVTRIPK
ncbi:MAG: hypothetical protein FGM61_03830, partial [Sediminibacterium sp.]|nr:hypothetical protein [Sediminibacterium sp.]